MERAGSCHTGYNVEGAEPQGLIENADKMERLRRWTQVEHENAAKEHVHYRDVLFDEVREHGQVNHTIFSDKVGKMYGIFL